MPPATNNPGLRPMWAMLLLVGIFCALAATGHGMPPHILGLTAVAALPGSIAFAAGARLLRGVTWTGAIAGWAVALLLWLTGGWEMFLLLLCVFAITFVATKLGYARKQRIGRAERRGGRDAGQVVANVGLAALIAVIAPPHWVVGVVAVLCEATADTVSSEIGQAFGGTPRLITNWRQVEPGVDGGITIAGTMIGAAGAVTIAGIAQLLLAPGSGPGELMLRFGHRYVALGPPAYGLSPESASLAAGAGIAGMLFDSVLGATLERRGLMDNDQVNGASTVFAALAVALVLFLVR